MNNDSMLEKGRLRDRFKGITTLAAFAVGIAVISIVVMNLLTYPVTVFAVKYKNAFNYIFKYFFIIGLIALFTYLVLATVKRLKKEGLSSREIALYILRRPLYALSTVLFIIAVSAAIIALLYILFSNNYYLIYKITT